MPFKNGKGGLQAGTKGRKIVTQSQMEISGKVSTWVNVEVLLYFWSITPFFIKGKYIKNNYKFITTT